MNRLLLALVLALTGYTAGTIVGSPRLPTATEAVDTLSPFLLVAWGILVASLGYSLSSLIGAVRKGGRNREDS